MPHPCSVPEYLSPVQRNLEVSGPNESQRNLRSRQMTEARSPRVRLTALWERRSKDGKQYFSGYLGNARLLIFRDDRSEAPDGAVALWDVYLEQAPPKRHARAEPTRAPPPRRAQEPAPGQGGQRVSFRAEKREEPATEPMPF